MLRAHRHDAPPAMDYVHSLPGRLRVRMSRLRGCPEEVQRLRALLQRVHGIRSVSTNDRLGSLLITYDTGVVGEHQLWEALQLPAGGGSVAVIRPDPSSGSAAPGAALAGRAGEALVEAAAQKLAEIAVMAMVRALI